MLRTTFSIRLVALTAVILAVFATACPTVAQDTVLINYQGYLTDADGNPLTGTYTQAFKVRAWWDPGEQELWGETHESVQVTNGFFSVILGSCTPMPDSIFNGDNRYLFISIDGDEEMDPPVLLTSAPGAVVSRRVVGDITTAPGLLQIHPPDPCSPDPCPPALELVADAETHAIKVHSPDPNPAETYIKAGIQEVDFSVKVGEPSDDEVSPISLRSKWSADSTYGVLRIAAATVEGESYWEGNPWTLFVDRDSTVMVFSRTDIFGTTDTVIEVAAMANSGAITITGEDATGGPAEVTLMAGSDGPRVGIGTASPVEALTVMGNGWFSGDVFTYTDTKVKTNIRPIDGALEKIDALNGYYYDCRTDEFPEFRMPKTTQMGLLAQEVSAVAPEVVRTDEQGISGVSYSRLTALLVEAVKELKAENEDLRARIARLEGR